MDRRTFLLSIAGAAASMALPETAEAADWVLLGTRRVNGRVDHDRIHVGERWGRFDRIRLRVRGNDLWLDDLDIRYGNGRNDDIRVRQHIRQGGRTRAIDLRGGNRVIRNVRFTYGKPRDGDGPTWVELWGRR